MYHEVKLDMSIFQMINPISNAVYLLNQIEKFNMFTIKKIVGYNVG